MDGLPAGSTETSSLIDGDLRVCIHRGAKQIGGTCVELSCRGSRILLDLGIPLDTDDEADPSSLRPSVASLRSPDPTLFAVIASHGHADHWGLEAHAQAPLKLVMGAASWRTLMPLGLRDWAHAF